MRRTDEAPRRAGQEERDPVRKFANQAPSVAPQDAAPEDASSRSELLPSKTRRKAAMHALQDLGEAMVLLTPARLAAPASKVPSLRPDPAAPVSPPCDGSWMEEALSL